MENYKSLYRKWRPQTFSDVYGQEHITKTLQNQVQNKKISHAYLFCGSRGTGKTTCAKILAKAVNCENPVNGNPCNVCASCVGIDGGRVIDVIEMDAASNNGVDNIRDMREEIAFTPGESLKKVYIIDEVHMLSQGAFNALLKTLEEPPSHIIFILATTEFNKIPATILSRCQRHDFRRIPPEVIVQRLKYIVERENILIEEEALNLIARLAAGALRDALSILEVCTGNSQDKDKPDRTITFEYVSQISGYFNQEKMIQLLTYIADGNAKDALMLFWEMYQNSLDCANFCIALLETFRNVQVAKLLSNPHPYIDLNQTQSSAIAETADKFSDAELLKCCSLVTNTVINLNRYTTNKKVAVEMLLIELCMSRAHDTDNSMGAVENINSSVPQVINKVSAVRSDNNISVMNTQPRNSPYTFGKYAEFVQEVAKENKMIAQFLKSGKCIINSENKTIIIYVDAEIKLEMLKNAENFKIVKNNLYKFINSDFSVSVEIISKDKAKSNDLGKNSIEDIIANSIEIEISDFS